MEHAMFFVEFGDHGKFPDPFPHRPAVINSDRRAFHGLLGSCSSAALYNLFSH
jgi:hypothetical protein